jgi:hypothetical protein
MPSSQPIRSVAIGHYALAVGAPAGTLISPASGISDDARAEVAEALEEETAGQVFEGAVAEAQEATTKVEQAESLLQDVLAGSLLDPADLSVRTGEMLKVLARLDKDGRYEEWLRYARAINGLLALAMRWARLVGSLRDVLGAAERVPELKRAVAWAEHELGTLHLAVEDAAGAKRRLERAREIRERLGDTDGLAATEQSLGVLCRQQALARWPRDGRRPDPRLLVSLIAALLLLLIGGVAGAMLDPGDNANALTVRIDGPGSVTSTPGGIQCPDTCDALFAADESVVLTASARPSATFAGWSGDCSGTGRCDVRADGARSVTARFEKTVEARTVTVQLAGGGAGEVTSAAGIDCPGSCRTSVESGSRVRLVPKPLGDSTFAGWTGVDCKGTDPCAFTVDGPLSITARFDPPPPGELALTVTPAGEGSGTVTSSPAGIACGQNCVRPFPRDSQVILTQVADEGSDFAGWGGACSGTKHCTVTLSGPREVTATFDLEQVVEFTLTTSGGITATTGSGDVGHDCAAGCPYPQGAMVTLGASPPPGTFSSWTGCTPPEGQPDTCTVTMDMNRKVSVSFPSSIR